MPNNITDVDEFTTTVQAPANGDAANEGTFGLAPQDLANRTRYLYNRSVGAKGGDVVFPIWAAALNESSSWSLSQYGSGPGSLNWVGTNNTDGLWFPVPMLWGAQLDTITVWIEGAAGHAASPANLPTLQVIQQDRTAGDAGTPGSTLVTATDTYGSAAAFEVPHRLTATLPSDYTMDADQELFIRVVQDNGTNSVAAMRLWGAYMTLLPGA